MVLSIITSIVAISTAIGLMIYVAFLHGALSDVKRYRRKGYDYYDSRYGFDFGSRYSSIYTRSYSKMESRVSKSLCQM